MHNNLSKVAFLLPTIFLTGCDTQENVKTSTPPSESPTVEIPEPAVGISRARLTPEQLDALPSTLMFTNESILNVLSEPTLSSVGIYSKNSNCLGTVTDDINPSELDIEGNPIGFTQARIWDGTVKNCTLDIHFSNSADPIDGSIPDDTGDTLAITFYIKPTSFNNAQNGVPVTIQDPDSSSSYKMKYHVTLPNLNKWHKIQLPLKPTSSDYSKVSIKWGTREDFANSFVIGGVEVKNYTSSVSYEEFPDTYAYYEGMEHDAPWRDTAEQQIALNRKDDFTISVLNSSGRVLKNKEMKVEQIEHEFKIGGAINNSLWQSQVPERNLVKFDEMLAIHSRIFNNAGMANGFKWKMMTNDYWNEYLNYTWQYWIDTGMHVRGHAVHWPKGSTTPSAIWDEVERLKAESGDSAASAYLSEQTHIRTHGAINETAHFVNEWDVINELPDGRDYFGENVNDDSDDGLLDKSIQLDWLNDIKTLNPNAEMAVNDYVFLRHLYQDFGDTEEIGKRAVIWNDLANRAEAHGIDLLTFGLQGHYQGFHSIPSVIQRLEDVTNLLPKYKEFEITEFDLPVYNDEVHAQFMADLLSVIFANEHYTGFMLWNWYAVEGGKPIVGFKERTTHFKNSNTHYKSGAAFVNFFYHKHWIHPTTLKTSNQGNVVINAYYGKYKVTVDGVEHIIDMNKASSREITLQL